MTRNLLFVLLASCNPTDPGQAGESANDSGPASTFEAGVDDLESATAAHGEAVLAANDAESVAQAESDWWGTCQSTWEQMDTCWEAMSGCGMMEDGWSDWENWMDEMWTAMQDHHDAMGSCGALADCHTMEMDWQSQMSQMFDQMHGMQSSWSGDCDW